MLIFDASLEEETIRAAVDRYVEFIRSKGDEPGRVDRWGKRRFAYELNHKWEGYYVVLEASAEPQTMQELHRVLSLADEVIRHKVIRIPDEAIKGRKNKKRKAREAASAAAAAGPEQPAVTAES
jgi:small subunit ribosomal protein S6